MCCSLKEVVLLAGSFAAGLTAQDSSVAEDQQVPGDVYTHWAYPRMKTDDNETLTQEIVLHRITPLDRAAEEQSKRVIASPRALTRNGIHSISRGQMLVSGFRGKASFVDVSSGQVNRTVDGPVEFLLVNPTHDSVIFSMPIFTVISQYDFASKTTRPLAKGSMQRSRSFATHTHSRIALSPDGHQLATATFAGSEASAALGHLFDIHIVDLQTTPPAARRLKHQFSGGECGHWWWLSCLRTSDVLD